MSLGAQQAGVEILAAVESCPHAAKTYSYNFPSAQVICGDIREVRELPQKPKGAVGILFGGPPCQGFSTSNQRTRTAQNPKNWLFGEFIRLAKEWEPDILIIENVRGILETAGGVFHQSIIEAVGKLGFEVQSHLLNAAEFGVPQRRSRVFIVGTRTTRPPRITPHLGLCPTVWDAIHDLPQLENGANVDELPYGCAPKSTYALKMRSGLATVTDNLITKNNETVIQRFACVPEGGNWEDIPGDLMNTYSDVHKCHTGIYRRLRLDSPSVVIGNYRKNMLIHPVAHRGLSVREAARLQSVPDQFRFFGSIGFRQQQVGNMVPPLLARAVAESVLMANDVHE